MAKSAFFQAHFPEKHSVWETFEFRIVCVHMPIKHKEEFERFEV